MVFVSCVSHAFASVHCCLVVTCWERADLLALVVMFIVIFGPVNRFPVKNTTDAYRFVYERRRYATMVKIKHGLATLNSNHSVVYGQKHKVWILVFFVRTSGTF